MTRRSEDACGRPRAKNAKNRQKRTWRAFAYCLEQKVAHRRRGDNRRAGRERRVNRRRAQRPNGGSPAAGRRVWARSAYSTRPSDKTHVFARCFRSIRSPTAILRQRPRRSFARMDAVNAGKQLDLRQRLCSRRVFGVFGVSFGQTYSQNSNRRRQRALSSLLK